MSVTLARESVASIEPEIPSLALAHVREVGCLPEADFDLALDDYRKLEALNLLLAFTAREGDKLIGYCIMNLCPGHSHFRRLKWAMQDSLYVLPSHRGVMPVRFILYMDLTLKAEGFDCVHRSDTPSRPYGRLLLHLSYRLTDRGYTRDLREAA